jgi:hypothetical protein
MDDEGYEEAKRGGFFGLFKWHFDRGTRAGLDPQRRGDNWQEKELAAEIVQEVRNIQNWYHAENVPRKYNAKLEHAFFGDPAQAKEDPYKRWRLDFREAHKQWWSRPDQRTKNDPRSPVQTETISGIHSSLSALQENWVARDPAPSRLYRGAHRFGVTLLYAIAGSIITLVIQFIAVATTYWRTGEGLEGSVGLFGAYAIPLLSAVIGAILGGLFSTFRFQRSKKPVLLED